MKKQLFLAVAAVFLAAPAFAQSEKTTTKDEATGAKTTTEVKVRDNGSIKTETDTRTGRTEAGEVINEAGHDTKEAGKKVANGTEKVADKTASGTKNVAKKTASGAKTVGKKAVKGVEKAGQKIDNTAEKGVEKAKDAVD